MRRFPFMHILMSLSSTCHVKLFKITNSLSLFGLFTIWWYFNFLCMCYTKAMHFDISGFNFCLKWNEHFLRWTKYSVCVFHPNFYNVIYNLQCTCMRHNEQSYLRTTSVGKTKGAPKMSIFKDMRRFVFSSLSIITSEVNNKNRPNFRLSYRCLRTLQKPET